MNKTFKVVFNKARGALVAVSESVGTVKKAGGKTAVALAVAAAACVSAQAETWTDKVISEDITIQEAGDDDVVVNSAVLQSGKVTVGNGINVNYDSANSKGDFSITGGELDISDSGNVQVRDFTMSGGKIVVTGSEGDTDNGSGRTSPAFGSYNSFEMTAGEIALTSNGRIWLGSASKSDPDSYARMTLKGGTVTLTDGGWITGNKRWITTDNSSGKYTGDGVLAYNTIGFDGAQVTVNGAGNMIDAVRTEITAGDVTVKSGGDLTVRATPSTAQSEGGENAGDYEQAKANILKNSAFVVSGGTLTIEENATLGFDASIGKLEIVGGTVNNNGLMQIGAVESATSEAETGTSELAVTIGQGGTLNTSIFQDNFKIHNVTVDAGGVFNIAALNSKTSSASESSDRLLIAYNNNWTLAGGDLQVGGTTYTGAIKIGTANKSVDGDASTPKGTGKLTVTAGDYTFGKIEFGSAEGNALTISGGNVNVATLDLTKGEVVVSDAGTLTTSSDQVFTVTGGSLFTSAAATASETTQDSGTTLGAALKGNISFTNGGTLALTDEGYYTSATLTAISTGMNVSSNNGQFVILNAKLAEGEKGELVDGIVQGTVDVEIDTAASEKGVVSVTANGSGAQSLTVTDEKATSLSVGGSGLTLTGTAEGGALVADKTGKALAVSVSSNTTLALGSDAVATESKGTLGDLTVDGTVEVVNMAADAAALTLNDGAKVTIGSDAKRGALEVSNLTSKAGSSIFLDPAVFGTVADASHFAAEAVEGSIAGEIVAGQNSIVTLGSTALEGAAAVENLLAQNGLAWGTDVTAAVYVAQPITVTGRVVADGSLTKENFTSDASSTAGTLSVAANGLLAANQAAYDGTNPLVTGTVSIADGGKLALVNAAPGEFKLATTVSTVGAVDVITDNPFVTGTIDAASGTVTGTLDAANGLQAIESLGLQATIRRADSVLAATIADRTSFGQDLKPGVNLWVDAAGESYKMDDMDNGGEFEADIGYGTFGADMAVGQFTVGGALQYGTGSLRSSVSGIKNNIDNYAVSLYGTYNVSDAFRLAAELAYVRGENDITSNQAALNGSVDTEMYSAGVRALYEIKAGDFSFVPSIGVRVSQLSTDAMQVGTVRVDDQDQTLVQVPIALRVSAGDFASQTGWKLSPTLKVAYVPTFGDKDITVGGVDSDVIDTSPVQMDLGLFAGKDNLLVNASLGLGTGKEGSSSVGGKIGLKYAF